MKKLASSIMAASLLFASATAAMAEQKITSTVTVTPQSQLTDDEQDAVTIAAARLLVHVDQAKQDLKKKEVDQAKQEVAKAIQLGEIIKSVMPGYVIKTVVKAGEKSYADTSNVKPLLVTLVEDIDEIAVLEPVRAAKRQASHSKGTAVKERLSDIEFQETDAKLDVALALTQLEDVKKDLEANKTDDAAKDLTEIQTDVDISVAVADMPVDKTAGAAAKATSHAHGKKHHATAKHTAKSASTTASASAKTSTKSASKEAPKAGKSEASATKK